MSNATLVNDSPRDLNPDDLAQTTDTFFREGCVLIPGVLTAEEVAALRAKTDECADSPTLASQHRSYAANAFVLRRCHEIDDVFRGVLANEAVARLAEAVLGAGARFNAMNVIRNEPGQAIAHRHVDDVLEFPLPDGIARFDPRIRMPVFWMTVQLPLSDIETVEDGPTQFVPGSHYSGRHPDPKEAPTFEGRGAESVFCRAGDAYLTNHQCWHRGAPNVSGRTRYLMQIQYAQRWADARFKGLA